MIVINTISSTKFSYNGINYYKNFTPVVPSNSDKVRILNTYDSSIELTDVPTLYSDFIVNGVTYTNISDLQDALLPVVYTRNSLGGGGSETIQEVLNNGNTVTDGTTQIFENTENSRATINAVSFIIEDLTTNVSNSLVPNGFLVNKGANNFDVVVETDASGSATFPNPSGDAEIVAYQSYVDDAIAGIPGGGGTTDLAYTPSPTNGVVTSSTGTDATIPLADGTNAGLFSPSEKTKLSGIVIDDLLNRANHTGTQDISTVTGLQTALDGKIAYEDGATYAVRKIKPVTSAEYSAIVTKDINTLYFII